ncbi:Uncharacterised protein [uncultured archaeon]|nr:Uncharacterised protein [uncultured archaeon]
MREKKWEKTAGIYSIGYEKKDIDLFLDLLVQNEIGLLVDVRHNPFSMKFAFTKSNLVRSLKNAGIGYLHVPELGIDGKYRKNLKNEKQREELFAFYSRAILANIDEKIHEFAELGKRKRIALMCFEADKIHCHRGILAEKLEEMGMEVKHI